MKITLTPRKQSKCRTTPIDPALRNMNRYEPFVLSLARTEVKTSAGRINKVKVKHLT